MNKKLDASYFLNKNIDENKELLEKNDKCDKYDYLAAVVCGAIGGLIDIFLVGSPLDSVIQGWTDKQVDNAVIRFAKMMGFKPKDDFNISNSINFLERKFKVCYDHPNSKSTKNLVKNMSSKNHHMKSLAHSPDVVGLFFSVLNQFKLNSLFIDNGQLITVDVDGDFELQGGNIIAKLFCGVANWFGHIMSDIAGSSGAEGRGSGIVIPFYELFQSFNFGNFNVDGVKRTISEIAVGAFENGYDFRFGLSLAMPVVITELLIRLIWSLRRYFQYKRPLKDCIPTQKHETLRVMLLFGHGTLCVMDGIDAGIRSGGNALAFFMRLNLIAWFRFIWMVSKEVFIRSGISHLFAVDFDAYKRINSALNSYIDELKNIDIELFRKETEKYNVLVSSFSSINSQEELNRVLLDMFEKLDISKPWEGSFDEHMSNKNGRLIFK